MNCVKKYMPSYTFHYTELSLPPPLYLLAHEYSNENLKIPGNNCLFVAYRNVEVVLLLYREPL